MDIQSFSVKQDVSFGVGLIEKLGDYVKKMGGTKVLLVTDPGLVKAGLTERVEGILNKAGIPYVTFSEVEPDPGCWVVEKAVKCMTSEKADLVVAFGGGSAMDTAKSAALVGYSGKRIHDYWGYYLPVEHDTVPVIAIPTTAGTGSEVTRNTVITDENKYKMVILNDNMLPQCALLDPELITTLPVSVAAATGLDALIHAVECYLSDLATPFSDAVAEKAMELIGPALPRFVANRKDIQAASDMLMGSTLAGITLSLCLPNQAHALSHPLTGYYHIPHGLANAMLFPTTMEYNALADRGKYKKIYNRLRCEYPYTDNFEPSMLIEYLKKLNEDLGLPRNLGEMGVTDEFMEEMLTDAQKTKIWEHCPRSTDVEQMRMLYEKAITR
ncbi:iron-containing alcohol dehydrogenase [Sediminispirochaeta smaragdinae]|uniref:Iron-containing alcohol dehydrogenase n=1 Tax=Sediminispirochaeta smaragdinae (strain DSM 11293 / JCM 15392 / SEBR 4228) TaxID=573413 RepID=E1R2B3_SEDSS|nr:iron-containing alcohol dehydrogenase [Sediminispirochaeta smaragdinae]ADK82473.1 iron-containing alcohol dehydrogenase [Sediminispirochaeta smaragdinae DSM 11293]